MLLLCNPGDDAEENLDEILESQEGLRGGEGDVPAPLFNPGRAGAGFGVVETDSVGGWAMPFSAGAGTWSIGMGGSGWRGCES